MDAQTLSAAVLAGGFSSRMGQDKAKLTFHGTRLIEYQVNKLKRLGIRDILLSGYDGEVDGTRCISDVYPHKGPLSGVHACLLAARNPACLFVGVDIPLVPAETLADLMQTHEGGATVLFAAEKMEPLLAVYDCSLAPQVEEILLSEKTSMKRFLSNVSMKPYQYLGDPELLAKCNTPYEFARIAAQEPRS